MRAEVGSPHWTIFATGSSEKLRKSRDHSGLAGPVRVRSVIEGLTPSIGSRRQIAEGGLRFFSTSWSVIIIIIGSTGHS